MAPSSCGSAKQLLKNASDLGNELLSSHIAHNFILSHIEVPQRERAKLTPCSTSPGAPSKIDTTPEEQNEGATLASAVFNDIVASQEDELPLFS